ncbi:2490_t:CDS:1, partial [Ambispora gerdemannii]
AKFPTESILDRDLSNAIQKFKIHTDEKLDASRLLITLLEHKSYDHQWAIEFELDNEN